MRNRVNRRRLAAGLISAAFIGLTGALLSNGAGADDGPHGFDGRPTGIRTDDPVANQRRDVSLPLRQITPIPPKKGAFTVKREFFTRPPASGTGAPDTALQSAPGAAAAPVLNSSFEGVGQGFVGPAGTFTVDSAPPDTNGQVGPRNYVQIVNSAFAIFDKAGHVLYGPAQTNTLFVGFGFGCEGNNDGDATVVYDRQADRWIISQFSVTTFPFRECVAVSTSGDPTGSYFRYEFQYQNFPDYPKMAVWSDAYYETFNLFDPNGIAFQGPEICAYDRAKMLAGAPATQQCFTLSTAFGSILPSNVDSAQPPPVGSPNYLLDFTTNALDFWKFHVDWSNPANTTLTAAAQIPVAPFAPACSGGACIPQPATTQQLDSLGDRLMFRLGYRNFGDHESLVVSHAVTAGSATGVRWYELRNPNGTPSVFQQGTYAPDATSRWMPSVAMDGSGNIGLGFSASSSAVKPGVHYTGHLTTDPAGVMGQGEGVVINGTGVQSSPDRALARWGDYSDMTIDPSDDCTFWFTSEYIATDGIFNWHTRIGSFRLAGCGSPDFSVAASPSSQTVSPGSPTTYGVTVTPNGGFTGSVSLSASGLPAGAAASFSPNPTTGSSTLTVTTSASTPVGSYPVTITGTSGTLSHSATVTLVVSQPDFSLTATPASRTVTAGTSTTYTVSVAPAAGFTGSVSLGASGLPAGASASFSPNPTTGTSTMTVTTTGSTPAGSYPVTVTGTSGSLSHATGVQLVVQAAPTPSFTLSSTPSTRTVSAGTATTYAVSVTPSGGFTGAVSLTASGLPAGASASFDTNPTTSTSTMTVATSTSTPGGTYTLTVTGTSGSLTRTTPVQLVVQAGAPAGADFSLSVTPTSGTVSRGGSASYTITVTPTNGFGGAVSLSASAMPRRVTASFSPQTTSSASTLTLATASNVSRQTMTVTVTGTSGSLSHDITLQLTIR
jgi:hypothetical protein